LTFWLWRWLRLNLLLSDNMVFGKLLSTFLRVA
jgi:hypothetical protein